MAGKVENFHLAIPNGLTSENLGDWNRLAMRGLAAIYASMDKTAVNAVTYTTGALENPVISKHVTDVLEGTRWAFGVRSDKYEVDNDAT
jgi:hypothetical protein